jgi:hypothetical protein
MHDVFPRLIDYTTLSSCNQSNEKNVVCKPPSKDGLRYARGTHQGSLGYIECTHAFSLTVGSVAKAARGITENIIQYAAVHANRHFYSSYTFALSPLAV